MTGIPLCPLIENEQESKLKPYLRLLTTNNLLLSIIAVTITNSILFLTLLGLLVRGNSSNVCTHQSRINTTPNNLRNNGSFTKSLPAFTHEITWKNFTYRYYIGDELVSWSSALNKCRDQGFEPLYVESVKEKFFLQKWLSVKEDSGIPSIQYLGIWTSGYRYNNMTHWLWETTGETVLPYLWSPGEPNNYQQNQRCIGFFFWSAERILFADATCEIIGRYICKRKNQPD